MCHFVKYFLKTPGFSKYGKNYHEHFFSRGSENKVTIRTN